jgi:hypothetical protein
MDFLDPTSWASLTQASWPYSAWQGSGYTMIWGVGMLPNTFTPDSNPAVVNGSCWGLTQEANGAYDSDFQTIARNMVNTGFGSSIVRIGWEFNLDWPAWAARGCPAAFVGAFRQIVTTMRAVSGSNFKFEWNPNRGDSSVGNLTAYYPGQNYVDYVGLDVYDVEWQNYPGVSQEFSNMQTQAYGLNWLNSLSQLTGKPMVFPEWGLGWGTCSAGGQPITGSAEACGGDDASFIQDMSQWFATHNVVEANYWDYGTSSVDHGSNPNTAAALRAAFG